MKMLSWTRHTTVIVILCHHALRDDCRCIVCARWLSACALDLLVWPLQLRYAAAAFVGTKAWHDIVGNDGTAKCGLVDCLLGDVLFSYCCCLV